MFQKPWRLVLTKAPRTVTIVDDTEGTSRLYCSCPFTRDFGLPCSDTLAVNELQWGLEDVDVFWLKAGETGELDCILPSLTASDSLLGPLFRRPSIAGLPTHPVADFVEQSRDSELPSVVSDEPEGREQDDVLSDSPPAQQASHSSVMRQCKDVVTMAGDNKVHLQWLQKKVEQLRREMFIELKLTSQPTTAFEPGSAEVVVDDPIVAAKPKGRGSCRRTRAASEGSAKRKKRRDEDFIVLDDINDVFGSQPGRRSKTKKVADSVSKD